MSIFGGSVDPFEVDLLVSKAFSRFRGQGFAQCNWTLLRANAAASDHDEVLFDHSVVRETALKF